MAILEDFRYVRPKTLSQVFSLVKEEKGSFLFLAGGTDLTVQIKEGRTKTPDLLIDLKDVKELKEFNYKGGLLKIGALTTFTQLIDSKDVQKDFPMLCQSAATVACVGIRNRATLVGNICSAVPSLDSAPFLLVYDAAVVIASPKGERVVPVAEFFTGPKKTVLQKDEIVVRVEVKKPAGSQTGLYVKLGRYRGEDLAQAGLGILLTGKDECRIAVCAVGPVPKRLPKIEKMLSGKALKDELIETAAKAVCDEISPITDIRATKEYRVHMMGVMMERGLKAAAAMKSGKKVHIGELLGG